MAPILTRSFLFLVLWLCCIVSASRVAVYKDTDCKTVVTTLTASDGYPDGLCTTVAKQISKDFQSFQFISLDSGCAGTVYQAGDDDACSGYAIVASLSTCYNTSWVDFSVDECTKPIVSNNTTGNATISTKPPTVSPTTASTTSSSINAAPSSTESTGSGASRGIISQTGSLVLCSAVIFGMYFLLL